MSEGVAGLMKSVSLLTGRIIPGGKVLDAKEWSVVCLWCMACISRNICLDAVLVSGSGAWFNMWVGVVSMFVLLGVVLCLLCGVECVLMDISGCGVVLVCVSCGLHPLPLDDTVLALLKYILNVTGGVGEGLRSPVFGCIACS